MNRALKRWLGYADDDELIAARRKALAELPPPPPPPEPVIRQPVQEIIRRMLDERPTYSSEYTPHGYVSTRTLETVVGKVRVWVKQTVGGYCGALYDGKLTHRDHELRVTQDEAEALYNAFRELSSMDYADEQMAARDAICAHLGVSTTQPT